MKVQTKRCNSLSSLGCLRFSLRSSFFHQVCSPHIACAQARTMVKRNVELHMGRWEANANEPEQ